MPICWAAVLSGPAFYGWAVVALTGRARRWVALSYPLLAAGTAALMFLLMLHWRAEAQAIHDDNVGIPLLAIAGWLALVGPAAGLGYAVLLLFLRRSR